MKKIIKIASVMICAVTMLSLTVSTNVLAKNYSAGNYEGKFEYIITNDEVTITNINKSIKYLKIPSKIDGFPVTTIGDSACENGKICNITFPNTIVTIENNAF